MKNIVKLIIACCFIIGSNATGQTNDEERIIHNPLNGLHLSGGFHSLVPTNNVLFPSIGSGNSFIERQTLSNEWYSPGPGAFLELKYNLGNERPFFVGYQYSFQSIFNDKHHPQSVDPKYPEIGNHYYLTKQVRHNNHMLFAEAPVYRWRNFNLYTRGELGLTHYMGEGKIHTTGSPKALESTRHNDIVFSAGLGIGATYQASDRLAFRLMAGYRFEGANNFKRRNYFSGLNASMGSVNDDFFWKEIEEPNDLVRPIRPRNESLYVQFGIVHHFDGRNLRSHRPERGEPIVDPSTAKKPILYLYPEEDMDVSVSLDLIDHEFIFTYPAYPRNGWEVKAFTDGRIHDYQTGRDYYSLFWETEGRPYAENIEEGYVVKGSETRAFLEERLEFLGLNYKEANEFLIFWLPMMENNPYNAIYFAEEEYEEMAKLNISPTPETLIRIMMMFQPLEQPIDLKPQILQKGPDRSGFTAVEWGGMEGEFFNLGREIQ